jgi:hypothetical protein
LDTNLSAIAFVFNVTFVPLKTSVLFALSFPTFDETKYDPILAKSTCLDSNLDEWSRSYTFALLRGITWFLMTWIEV